MKSIILLLILGLTGTAMARFDGKSVKLKIQVAGCEFSAGEEMKSCALIGSGERVEEEVTLNLVPHQGVEKVVMQDLGENGIFKATVTGWLYDETQIAHLSITTETVVDGKSDIQKFGEVTLMPWESLNTIRFWGMRGVNINNSIKTTYVSIFEPDRTFWP